MKRIGQAGVLMLARLQDRFYTIVYPLAWLAGGTLIACNLPATWNVDTGPLSWLTGVTSQLVPSVQKYAAMSALPGVTSTYLSLLWSLLPALVWLSTRMLDEQMGSVTHRVLRPPRTRAKTSGAVLVLFGAMFAYVTIVLPVVGIRVSPTDLEGTTIGAASMRAFSQSRLWLGLLGALVVWICSVGIAMLLRVVAMAFRGLRKQ